MAAYLMADVLPDDLDKNLASGHLDAAVRTASAQRGFYRARGALPCPSAVERRSRNGTPTRLADSP